MLHAFNRHESSGRDAAQACSHGQHSRLNLAGKQAGQQFTSSLARVVLPSGAADILASKDAVQPGTIMLQNS